MPIGGRPAEQPVVTSPWKPKFPPNDWRCRACLYFEAIRPTNDEDTAPTNGVCRAVHPAETRDGKWTVVELEDRCPKWEPFAAEVAAP